MEMVLEVAFFLPLIQNSLQFHKADIITIKNLLDKHKTLPLAFELKIIGFLELV